MSRRNRDSGNGLLRSALNSGRVSSSNGRSTRRDTPRSQRSAQGSIQGSVQGSRDVSDDELETQSIMSDDTWPLDENDDEVAEIGDDWEEQLATALDSLNAKRVSTRERALQETQQLMSHVYVGDGIAGGRVTLLEALRKCARSTKSSAESERALLVIGLWFVNFGTQAEAEAEFAAVNEQLRAQTVNEASSDRVRALAVATLGLANFISGADFHDAAELARFVQAKVLEPALTNREAHVARQAFTTLGLLLTVVGDSDTGLLESLFDAGFDAHLRGLMADSVGVRVAAAHNFALVHEALSSSNQHDTYTFDRHDELVGMLEMLRHESSKRHAKRDTTTQRTTARDVLRSIEEGANPELSLKVCGRSVSFDSWARILRLHAFRAVLGGGLPVHFARNELLQDVFEVEFDPDHDEYLRNSARQVVSPSSELAKMRTRNMRRRRDAHRDAQTFDDDE